MSMRSRVKGRISICVVHTEKGGREGGKEARREGGEGREGTEGR